MEEYWLSNVVRKLTYGNVCYLFFALFSYRPITETYVDTMKDKEKKFFQSASILEDHDRNALRHQPHRTVESYSNQPNLQLQIHKT